MTKATRRDDEAGIRAALMDYFGGWFDGDPVRMESALHPELPSEGSAKRGRQADRSPR